MIAIFENTEEEAVNMCFCVVHLMLPIEDFVQHNLYIE